MTGLRVMCLSNMYPGPDAPDYGAFIARMCGGMRVSPCIFKYLNN